MLGTGSRESARSRPQRSARELEADEVRVEPVDGGAAEERVVRVVEVAVGRVRVEQLRHLVHEPLEDGLEPELARHDLGRLEERRLLFEALRVLVEQLRGVDRDPEFARNGLGERDLGIRPRARLRAVEPEDADHPVERRGPASRGRRALSSSCSPRSRRVSDP